MRSPGLDVKAVQTKLLPKYPELLVTKTDQGSILIRGSFPVYVQAHVLDRFHVEIRICSPLAVELPRLWEVGGRIPRTPERHIDPNDDSACLQVPEEWLLLPESHRNLDTFLSVPVRNFFLGQIVVEAAGQWPFGERDHGIEGLLQSYREMLDVDGEANVTRYFQCLSKDKVKGHLLCPCGSGEILRRCHVEKVRDLQQTVSPKLAQAALARLSLARQCRQQKGREIATPAWQNTPS